MWLMWKFPVTGGDIRKLRNGDVENEIYFLRSDVVGMEKTVLNSELSFSIYQINYFDWSPPEKGRTLWHWLYFSSLFTDHFL